MTKTELIDWLLAGASSTAAYGLIINGKPDACFGKLEHSDLPLKIKFTPGEYFTSPNWIRDDIAISKAVKIVLASAWGDGIEQTENDTFTFSKTFPSFDWIKMCIMRSLFDESEQLKALLTMIDMGVPFNTAYTISYYKTSYNAHFWCGSGGRNLKEALNVMNNPSTINNKWRYMGIEYNFTKAFSKKEIDELL